MNLKSKIVEYKNLVNKEIGKAKGNISYTDFIDSSPKKGKRSINRGLWLPYSRFVDYDELMSSEIGDMSMEGGDMGIGEQEEPDLNTPETNEQPAQDTPAPATPEVAPELADTDTATATPETGNETEPTDPVDPTAEPETTDSTETPSDLNTGSITPSFGGGGSFTPSASQSAPTSPATSPAAPTTTQAQPTQTASTPNAPSSQIKDERQSEQQVVTQVFIDKMVQVLDKLDTIVSKVSEIDIASKAEQKDEFSLGEIDKEIFPFNMKFSDLHYTNAQKAEDKVRSYSDGDIRNSLLNY